MVKIVMKFIIGLKKEMTQKFTEDGTVTAVTVISAENCRVIAMKTKERDGYVAACVAYGNTRLVKKPQRGVFKDLGNFRSGISTFR